MIYRLYILYKANPMIMNLTRYDCDISSRGSINFSQGTEERGFGVEGEVTKGGRGGVGLR